jgi:ribosomal protein S18 acetylase RimI-like enzyme
MKRDEPFNPNVKSIAPPANLIFRLAERKDREAISGLMAQRNPDKELSEIYKTTDRELESVERDPKYRLYVGDLNGIVVGLSRFYHSSGLPESKKVYPSPEGWYAMGTIVSPDLRRQGIARFLFENRFEVLRERGVSQLYSFVDSSNLTSLNMHRSFGFEEVTSAQGFLNIKFESGSGILFQKFF